MARDYAGILGLLAMLTSLARGVMHGGEAESVVPTAWCGLLLFSAIGYVVGWVAERTVADSVSERIAAELANDQQDATPQSAAPGAA